MTSSRFSSLGWAPLGDSLGLSWVYSCVHTLARNSAVGWGWLEDLSSAPHVSHPPSGISSVTKGTPLEEMIRAIKKIHAGSRYFSHDVAEQLAETVLGEQVNSPFDTLSEREKQVAMMVVNCQSTQEIADQLFVSTKTVNTYRYRIFEKLGVDSDVKLTHLAIRHGLIQT